MIGWCVNELLVEGDEKHLNYFIRDFKYAGFEALIPVPQELEKFRYNVYEEGFDDIKKQLTEKYGTYRKSKWCSDNWGTLENCYFGGIKEVDKNKKLVFFDTELSPPDKWLIFASKRFPSLKFTLFYRDDEFWFEGMIKVEKGEVKENIWVQYTVDAIPDLLKIHGEEKLLERFKEIAEWYSEFGEERIDVEKVYKEKGFKGLIEVFFKDYYP